MTEPLFAPGNHVVAYRTHGRADDHDVATLVSALEARLGDHPHLSVMLEVTHLEGLTLDALLRDLSFCVRQLGYLHRIARVAIVTDLPWTQTATEWESHLMPGVELWGFDLDQRAESYTWVSSLPGTSPPALVPLAPPERAQAEATSGLPVFAYALLGPFGREDAIQADEALSAHPRFRLYVRIEGFGLPRLNTLSANVARIKKDLRARVDRYAVVGAPGWVEVVTRLIDPLLSMSVRCFDVTDEAAAWAWLGEAAPAHKA